jgi:hypothetical protein
VDSLTCTTNAKPCSTAGCSTREQERKLPLPLGSRNVTYYPPLPNPHYVALLYHATPIYICTYAMEMAYIQPPSHNETPNLFRKCVYLTLHAMTTETLPAKSTRIETKHTNQNWPQIWRNLHEARIPETIRSNWYNVIHYVIPTKQRLHRIALTNTDRCAKCD